MLVNTNDKSEHSFQLIGIGERPLAQENINIHTRAKERCVCVCVRVRGRERVHDERVMREREKR